MVSRAPARADRNVAPLSDGVSGRFVTTLRQRMRCFVAGANASNTKKKAGQVALTGLVEACKKDELALLVVGLRGRRRAVAARTGRCSDEPFAFHRVHSRRN